MSIDTGTRKRIKDKKRKKGNIGEGNITPILQRETPVTKLVMDETIHVHNDAKFGGNILSKFVFFAFLCAIGMILLLIFAEYNSYGADGTDNQFLGLPKFSSMMTYFTNQNTEESIDKVEEIESQADQNYFDYFWKLLPFLRSEKSIEILNKDKNDDDSEENISNSYNTNEMEMDSAEDEEDDKIMDDLYDTSNSEDLDANKNDDDENETDNPDDDDDMLDYDNYDTKRREENNLDDDGDSEEDDTEYNENANSLEDDEDENDDLHRDNFPYDRRKSTNTFDFGVRNDDDENDSAEDTDGNDKDGDEAKNLQEDDFSQERINNENTEVELKSSNINQLPENENILIDNSETIQSQFNDDIFDNTKIDMELKIQNTIDYFDEEEGRHLDDNETLREYLDSSTGSESEDTKESTMRWSTSGPDILAHEVGDSNSVTSDSDSNNSDDEQNSNIERDTYKDYDKANITNPYDWQYRGVLDDADEDLENGRVTVALEKYRTILQRHEHSVRARYGIAKSLDVKAELQKSNELLAKVIDAYVKVLLAPDVCNALFRMAAERAIDRMRFKGDYISSIGIHNLLIDRFPDEIVYQNELVVTLFILNRISEAKEKLEKMLLKWPDNGLAMVHFGFVLKLNGNLTEAVHYLDQGIKTNENGTQDGRFYFHLGDALQRLKRNEEARLVYRKGVEKGLFNSEYQRSLYNVKRLTGRPWWTQEQTTYLSFFRTLEQNWEHIRDEGLSLLKGRQRVFMEESEQLRETGDWQQFELFSRGIRRSQCSKVPITCRLISDFQPASECRRGQAKFSLMEPGTHVWPHCGPTNCRLRAHLGLVVPANVTIRVASETRTWKEGRVIVFDDSFEHEVWHNGTSSRLILIVDVWHPELTQKERKTLFSI